MAAYVQAQGCTPSDRSAFAAHLFSGAGLSGSEMVRTAARKAAGNPGRPVLKSKQGAENSAAAPSAAWEAPTPRQ